MSIPVQTIRDEARATFQEIQRAYCAAVEEIDGGARFHTDLWERPTVEGAHGGGGCSRVLKNGRIFEQAGINFSEVRGLLPSEMSEKLTGDKTPQPFYATGTSLVLHPHSPMIPTTHANVRYLEVGDHAWFGGGADLTPYYLFDEDAVFFHQGIKRVCDTYDMTFYPRFKKWCDEYFYLPHRKEARGIGGVFFDYLGKGEPNELSSYGAFVQAFGRALPEYYLPIVKQRAELPYSEEQKHFQLIRRGRYVEFNLLYDRGTLFGLKTDGRTESILMSLPPLVRWEYDYQPTPGSPEAYLIETLRQPRAWIA
jgi:coproporphyrinogen III oxidase